MELSRYAMRHAQDARIAMLMFANIFVDFFRPRAWLARPRRFRHCRKMLKS